jgi:predicted amidohydrolase
MMICMDREYADVAGALSGAGAEVTLVPNCCDLGMDPDIGDVRIAQTRGRAFETVMGIAVANYPRPKADGHSFGVGPVGEILAMGGEAPELVVADFDLDLIRRTREEDWFRWRDQHAVAAK